MIQDHFVHKGQHVTATWMAGASVDDFQPYKQVYCVPFTRDGQVLIIKQTEWIIPGGKPELGETAEQTLHRELYEEATVIMGSIQLIGAFKIEIEGYKNGPFYQLRYAGIIDVINEQTEDPDKGITHERRFIKPEEFNDYVQWGPVGHEMFRLAYAWFQANRS